jgi:hypothetical protein
LVENLLQLKKFFKALWCGTLLPIHRAFFIPKNMNLEVLFNRAVTEDQGSIFKLIKCDTGIVFEISNVDFIHPEREDSHTHFISTERLDEFIGILTYIKSTL